MTNKQQYLKWLDGRIDRFQQDVASIESGQGTALGLLTALTERGDLARAFYRDIDVKAAELSLKKEDFDSSELTSRLETVDRITSRGLQADD